MPSRKDTFLILSWALYDLANQFFALNVVSLYFVRWLTIEHNKPEILYSLFFGISTFFVAILGLILGARSDVTGKRRPYLVSFTLLSIIFTILIGTSNVFWGLIFFAIANFGCQIAVVFYNAMLADIAPRDRIGLVSGLGRMFAYSGAILALYLIKPVVLKSGYSATFLPTGLLFLFFSLPCMIFVKDRGARQGLTFSGSRGFPGLVDFLKGLFFVLCAVNAVILFMSVYATRAFGLGEAEIINLIAFSTVFAILGSLFSGFISDILGYKRTLCGVFILWGLCFLIGSFAKNIYQVRFVGAMVGIALGSIWVVSRAFVIRLVPHENIGRVFGLFNLIGYSSAIVGAVFWGLIVLFLRPFGETGYRIALFSLNFFVLFGIIFLIRMPGESSRTEG